MKLQLALDVLKIKEALRIAKQAAPYVDIIEAGTPLIKQECLSVIKQFKKFRKTILADMKTMDTGALEARMAFSAGADITTVCLAASKETILGAMDEGKAGIMLDTIGLNKREIITRLKKLKTLPSYICLHRAIDQKLSKSIESLLSYIKDVRKIAKKTKIAIAGSIDDMIAKHIAKLGKKQRPNIVIVGAAITKAKDPAAMTKKIKQIIK